MKKRGLPIFYRYSFYSKRQRLDGMWWIQSDISENSKITEDLNRN